MKRYQSRQKRKERVITCNIHSNSCILSLLHNLAHRTLKLNVGRLKRRSFIASISFIKTSISESLLI